MLEKINEHYSFTAPATIYDEEALTTLELSARTAGKVNECVDVINRINDGVTEDIKTQKQLLKTIDDRVKDFIGYGEDIETAGSYEVFKTIVNQLVDEGKFAEVYDLYSDYLKGLLSVESRRIDTLIGGATPSSDSEIIDLRIDCDGRVWNSAGASVRNSLNTIFEHLHSFTRARTEEITPLDVNEDVIWQDAGEVRAGFGHCKRYKVNPAEHYLVSAYYGYSFPDVIFSDGKIRPDGGDGLNVIGIGNKNPTGFKSNNFDRVIRVPEGASEMYVQWADNDADISLIKAKRVKGYSLNYAELEEFITTTFKPLNSLKPSYSICAKDNTHTGEGYILRMGENGVINNNVVESGSLAYKTASYIVKAGEHIKFECCANYGNVFYYLHNSESKEILKYEVSENIAAKQTIERELVVPLGYNRLTLANVDKDAECYYMAGVRGASPLAGIKALVIGDSISEYNTSAERNYLKVLSENAGLEVVNVANSGAGFLNEKDNNTHYLGQLITTSETSPNVVIVMGSGNDLKHVINNLGDLGTTNTNTLFGQMKMVYEMATATRFTGNPKVCFIAPVAWQNYTPEKENNVMEQYVEAMRKFCRANAIPFLDLYHESGLNPANAVMKRKYFDSQGVHPNDAGHKFIASAVYKFLLGVVGMEAE